MNFLSINIKKTAIILFFLLLIFFLSLFIRLHTINEPYLMGWDSFFFFREAKYVATGDEIYKDPLPDLRFKDSDLSRGPYFFVYLTAYTYKLFNSFIPNLDFTRFCFWFSAILSTLSVFSVYLIGRYLFNPIAGLFSAFFFTLSPYYLRRSMAGELDNDAINLLLLTLAFALFFGAFFYLNKKNNSIPKISLIFSFLSGLSITIFAWTWNGYWLAFLVILSVLFCHLLISIFNEAPKSIKGKIKSGLLNFKNYFILYAIIFATFFSSGILLLGKNIILDPFWGVFSFFYKKTGLRKINYDYFPGVQYNVSELKAPKYWFPYTIEWLGTASFILGIIGLIVLFFIFIKRRKEKKLYYAFPFVLILFFATFVPFLKAQKFGEYFALASAILAGFFIVELWKKGIDFLKNEKKLAKIILVFIGVLTFFSVVSAIYVSNYEAKVAKTAINEDLASSFSYLKNSAPSKSVVVSWWDLGYLITALAQRQVIVDGGTFNELKKIPLSDISESGCSKRGGIINDNYCLTSILEDIAKVLFTDSDKEAVDILKDYRKENSDVYLFLSTEMLTKSSTWTYCATWDKDKKTGQKYNYVIEKFRSNEIVDISVPKELEKSLMTRLLIKNEKSDYFSPVYDNGVIKIYKVNFSKN